MVIRYVNALMFSDLASNHSHLITRQRD